MNIFAAAHASDAQTVQACLDAGADVSAVDEHGFTALQRAAMGANQAELAENLAVLRLLLQAGSSREQRSRDGRTALFLAAEFAPSTDAVQTLLDAGAEADVYDDHGNHVVDNALMPEVKQLLACITGKPVPAPPAPSPVPVRMRAAQWRAAQARIRLVFDALSNAGIVALQEVGYSQEDGFSDCAEEYRSRGGTDAGLHGFCFYTEQDATRAKRTSQLAVAFWGAPEGGSLDMDRVGTIIVNVFRQRGFTVAWNGLARSVPSSIFVTAAEASARTAPDGNVSGLVPQLSLLYASRITSKAAFLARHVATPSAPGESKKKSALLPHS
jgi:bifunctional non-homologous end joining protein LigD